MRQAAAPLDGQHHQVQGVHRLHLQPGRAPAARAVGGGQVLDDDALVAAFQGVGEEGVGGRAGAGVVRVGDEGAADPQVLREEPGQGRVTVGVGQVEQVLVVDDERVEEDRHDGHVRRRSGHVPP